MIRYRGIALLLVFALLAVPGAGAADDALPTASLTADRLTASYARILDSHPRLVAKVGDGNVPGADMALVAGNITVRTDIGTAPVAVVTFGQTESSHTIDAWTSAYLTTTNIGTHHEVFVVPQDLRLQVVSPQIHLLPATGEVLDARDVPGQYPEQVVDTAGSLRLLPRENDVLTLQGNFTMVLFEWEFHMEGLLEGSRASRDYFSGERESNSVGGVVRVEPEFVVTILFVTDGILTLALPDVGIYLDAATLVADTLNLAGATGDVHTADGAIHVRGQSVRFDGYLLSTLVPTQDGVAAEISGRPETATIGGTVVVLPQDDGGGRNLWTAVVLAPIALAFGWWRLGPPHYRRLDQRIDAWMDQTEYDRVMAHIDKLIARGKYRAKARLVKALALIRQGYFVQAEEILDISHDADPATRWYLRAYLRAALGDHDAATDALERSLSAAPTFRVEMQRNPVFRPLLENSALRKRLQVATLRDASSYG